MVAFSFWHCQEHSIEEAFFLAVFGIESREGVGEAEEIRAALGFGFEQGAQGAGLASRLEEHRGVDAVERGGLAPTCGLGGFGFGTPFRGAATAFSATLQRDVTAFAFLFPGKKRILGALAATALNRLCNGLSSGLPEELFGALRDRNQPHDAFLGLDDPVFPILQVNPQRLCEPPCHVIDQHISLLRLSAVLFFLLVLGLLFVLLTPDF